MRVVIFDYGAGNIHSLAKAVALAGAEPVLETDPTLAIEGDALILPGVGAFGLAAARLAPGLGAMRQGIRGGLPTLGICLGMQLLFTRSDEGEGEGLALFDGSVTRLTARHVPQIGWNTLERVSDPLAVSVNLTSAYFANGFACRPEDAGVVTAWAEHEGDRFPAIVRRAGVVGTQFHPEKSSAPGVRFIGEWLEGCRG